MTRLRAWQWLLIVLGVACIAYLAGRGSMQSVLNQANVVIGMKDGTIKGYEKLMADVMKIELDEARIRGDSSWYGPGFEGRPTSSAEIFSQEAMTAAHKTLPLGCIVRVYDIQTGESVIVKINDRGPFVGDRVIDLSRRAARELGFERRGVIKVAVQVLWTPVDRPVTPGSKGD